MLNLVGIQIYRVASQNVELRHTKVSKILTLPFLNRLV